MANIIQQLKDNEKPFGLMSKEMKAKAVSMGFHSNFRVYSGYGDCGGFGNIIDSPKYGYNPKLTYRLRSDYAEEPEIEERLIMPAGATMSSPGKYRAKPVDGGEMVHGFLAAPDQIMIWDEERAVGSMVQVIPESVGQYIGLKDKNRTKEFPDGQPVCEGDIVESVWQVDHKTKIVGQVTYYSVFALWSLMDSKGDMVSPCWNESVVIGNIHDNPNLLKGQA